jgi:hypothetical protein
MLGKPGIQIGRDNRGHIVVIAQGNCEGSSGISRKVETVVMAFNEDEATNLSEAIQHVLASPEIQVFAWEGMSKLVTKDEIPA